MGEKYTSSYAYKVGSRWRIGVKYRDEETGLWKDRTSKCGATRKADARREAEQWRMRLNDEEAERASRDVGLTVGKYVRSYIDAKVASGVVSKKTANNYEQDFHAINDPDGKIARIPLADLTPSDVREWFSWLLGEERGLKPSTAKTYYSLLRQAMKQAAADRVIQWNPLDNVKQPKVPKSVPNSLDAASMVALDKWLKSTEPTVFRTMVALAYYGGMRLGECAALSWANVDFERRALLVCQSDSTGRIEDLKATKVERRRIVPISNALGEILRERYEQMLDDMAVLYPDDSEWELERRLSGCFACGYVDGSLCKAKQQSTKFTNMTDTLGLTGIHSPHVTFHTLRHTFATRLINEGVDVKTVSSILGHANASMTLDVYAASDPEAVIAAAPRIDKALSVASAGIEDEPTYSLPSAL